MEFTKENTKRMKGISVLMMLAYHIFCFPTRYSVVYDPIITRKIEGEYLYAFLGKFGELCVPLFVFLGGGII